MLNVILPHFSAPELIETVEGGVKHILASCTEHGVKSIVLTSSGGKD